MSHPRGRQRSANSCAKSISAYDQIRSLRLTALYVVSSRKRSIAEGKADGQQSALMPVINASPPISQKRTSSEAMRAMTGSMPDRHAALPLGAWR